MTSDIFVHFFYPLTIYPLNVNFLWTFFDFLIGTYFSRQKLITKTYNFFIGYGILIGLWQYELWSFQTGGGYIC